MDAEYEFHQRLVIVLDWRKGHCEAETYGHHFLSGVKASGINPSACMTNLARAWREDDRRQAFISLIDMGDVE